MYQILGRRNGQFWDARASFLCGAIFPDFLLRPAVAHSQPLRGSATWKPRAKGKIKPVRPEAVSAGALTNCNITLQLTWTQRALYLPVATLLSHHIAPLLSTLAPPAHCGVPQCVHHRPPGTVRPTVKLILLLKMPSSLEQLTIPLTQDKAVIIIKPSQSRNPRTLANMWPQPA